MCIWELVVTGTYSLQYGMFLSRYITRKDSSIICEFWFVLFQFYKATRDVDQDFGSASVKCGSGSSFKLNGDPEQAFPFNADTDSATHQGDANLRPLADRSSRLSL